MYIYIYITGLLAFINNSGSKTNGFDITYLKAWCMPLTHSQDDFSIHSHYLTITRVGLDRFGIFLRIFTERWQGFANRNEWFIDITDVSGEKLVLDPFYLKRFRTIVCYFDSVRCRWHKQHLILLRTIQGVVLKGHTLSKLRMLRDKCQNDNNLQSYVKIALMNFNFF